MEAIVDGSVDSTNQEVDARAASSSYGAVPPNVTGIYTPRFTPGDPR
jgi:hypothetical protein